MIFLSLNKGDTVTLTVNANYETTPSNNNFLGTAYTALFSSFDAAYGSGVENGISSSSSTFDEALNGIDMSGKGNSSTDFYGSSKCIDINIFIFSILVNTSEYSVD
ncbi:MAG: hypothetical protein AAGI25_21275 [Bacteroidota bacterium]